MVVEEPIAKIAQQTLSMRVLRRELGRKIRSSQKMADAARIATIKHSLSALSAEK